MPMVSIQEAKSDVPADYAKFLGIWGNASWEDQLCHILAVVSVNKDGEADVRYSYGRSDEWYIDTPRVLERTGKIEDGVFTLEWESQSGKHRLVRYMFNSGGLLEGIYSIDRGDFYIEPHLSKLTVTK